MSDAARIFAFDACFARAVSAATIAAGVSIVTRRPRSMLNVRGNPADAALARAMLERFDVTLPVEPNTAASTGATRILWLGPDEWLLVSDDTVLDVPPTRQLENLVKPSLIPDPSPGGRRERNPSPFGRGRLFEPSSGRITNPPPFGRAAPTNPPPFGRAAPTNPPPFGRGVGVREAFEAPPNVGNGTITDVSHGRAALRVFGPEVRAALAKGCPLDLHPNEFPLNRCAQTAIAKVPVILDHVQSDVFDLYCPRSYAGSFWHWLTEAAAEYGCNIAGDQAA